jgi:hypothetical protein
MTSSLPGWITERITPAAPRFAVSLTRRDLIDGEITDTTFMVKTLFDTRHEANVYGLAAMRYPHIVAAIIVGA